MFGMGGEFRKVLDECLSRMAGGESPQACLAGYPQHASKLQPYLETAAALRGLSAPEPAASARQGARQKLLNAVAGVEDAPAAGASFLPSAMLRLGSVGAALAMFIVAAMGASAFLGEGNPVGGILDALNVPNPIAALIGDDGEDDGVLEFTGEAISISSGGVAIRTDDDVVMLRYTSDTEFEWESGEPASAGDVQIGMSLFARAEPVPNTQFFDVLLLRLLDGSTPSPTAAPEPTATPAPEATATPEPEEPTPTPEGDHETKTPTPEPKPSVCTAVAFDGKILSVGSGTFSLKTEGVVRNFGVNSETVVLGYLAAGIPAHVKACKFGDGSLVATKVTTYPQEFWATVVSASGAVVTVKIEGAGSPVTLHKTAETDVSGPLYANVKVTVKAYKKSDGSYQALSIVVKTTEFSGKVSAINGSTYTVTNESNTYSVKTNGETDFVGNPVIGAGVTVKAYKLGDGTYLAYKIIAEAPPVQSTFTGTLKKINAAGDTIWVELESTEVRTVCIEFSDVVGTLTVGVTVKVYVDHVEGGTYFASLVKVIS